VASSSEDSLYCCTLHMRAQRTVGTLGIIYQSTRLNIPLNLNLQLVGQFIACYHATATNQVRFALLWAIMQCIVAIPYRRFDTPCRSHRQGSRIQKVDCLAVFDTCEGKRNRACSKHGRSENCVHYFSDKTCREGTALEDWFQWE
jgi:hypothetical protein